MLNVEKLDMPFTALKKNNHCRHVATQLYVPNHPGPDDTLATQLFKDKCVVEIEFEAEWLPTLASG